MDIFRPKWDEIPNAHFGFHFFDSLVLIPTLDGGFRERPPKCPMERFR